MNSHELWRGLLHALVADADEVLHLTLVVGVELLGRDEVAELGLVLDHLVLDVERAEEDVNAHVERTEAELELEALEHGVDEQPIRLGRVERGAEDGRLDAVDLEGELERLLVKVRFLWVP